MQSGHHWSPVQYAIAAALMMVVVIGSMQYAESADLTEQKAFARPTLYSLPVDVCVAEQGSCGPLSAYNFCLSQGYEKATSWSSVPAAKTWMAGSGQICEVGPNKKCTSLRDVICTRIVAPPGSRMFEAPKFNGMAIDHCRISGNDCGRGAADQFCRSMNFDRANSWISIPYGETWNIGSHNSCKSSSNEKCEALKDVVCSGGLESRYYTSTNRIDLQNPQLVDNARAIENSNRLDDAVPYISTINSWMGDTVEQLRGVLSSQKYGHLVADFSTAILPYSRIAGMNGVDFDHSAYNIPPMSVNWDYYYKFGLVGSRATSQAITAHLEILDKRLTKDNRKALNAELQSILSKYR